jgi:hypothetical protein
LATHDITRHVPYYVFGNNWQAEESIAHESLSEARIHRRNVCDLWTVISVMTTFLSWFSPRLDQICTMNKSVVLLVQSPQIQPIGWSRYLDKKKTSRWFSEDYYYFTQKLKKKLLHMIKYTMF